MMKRRAARAKAAAKPSKVKDDKQFLEALKLYESKSYKKSLKILDGILKKDSGNVDALALKGLDLLSISQKEEAEQYVDSATKRIEGTNASPICCHVLGIYMRTVKNYPESIKWFEGALKAGSSNQQIYRDLATLQSQICDYKAVLDSRKKYWQAFMGYRANWTALAVAQDINGEYQQAVNTLSQFEKLAQGKLSEAEMYENNECLIYKNDIMYRTAGDNPKKLQNVLRHLDDIENDAYDKYALLERRAEIYFKLGDRVQCSKICRTLIQRNPDNFKYYEMLEKSLGIQENNKLRKAMYEKLQKFYPRAEPPKYLPLTFIENRDELRKQIDEYIVSQLKRGVPATFSNVKPLYKQRAADVCEIIEQIVLQYFNSLDRNADPISYIWTCYYLCQHYLFKHNLETAMKYIDMAIEHTPTMVEFYMLKARVLKHMEQPELAAQTLEEGRKLDLQDRYVNCKAVKYFLRANNIDKAVELASLFTKNDDSANGVKDLHLVEAAWFIIEQAEAYYRLYLESKKKLQQKKEDEKKEFPAPESEANETETKETKELEWTVKKYKGLSLKRFIAISKFYHQFEDDQLDFHSYCMRKGTIRAYLEMVEWGKTIYTKPMYLRALEGASKIYFEINDEQLAKKHALEHDSETVKSNSNKKLKRETAALHKLKEAERKYVMAYPAEQDKDVFGEQLVDTEEPLKEFSTRFYADYLKQIDEAAENYILDFEFQYRSGKLALCLASINKYSKQPDAKEDMVRALCIILALASGDGSDFEEIPKKVAAKGLEAQFSTLLPLQEVDNANFNWTKFFQEQEKDPSPEALAVLSQHGI